MQIADDLAEQGRTQPSFSISPDELVDLFECRTAQALTDLGGLDHLAAALSTNLQTGLSSSELDSSLDPRLQYYGSNQFKYPPPKNFFRLMLEGFKDVTIIILSLAAIVSLTIGLAVPSNRAHYGYLEGSAIVLVVLIVIVVQAVIDGSKEAKFRQLNSVKDNYDVQVIRGGEILRVKADQIVVGDLLNISAGDKLPADALLVTASALKTNESAMTGEPIDISKHPNGDLFLLSGTTVSEGVATVMVVAVGERSQWGVILKGLIVQPENTPLQDRLDRLAWSIGKLGILFAVLTFVVSLVRWIVESARAGEWEGVMVLDFFIDAVTIVVVAIPEGLPLAITLGLSFAMRKMMKDMNLVRRLEACETMGSATQLNADKTGTLTQNRMTVVEASWTSHHVVYDVHHPNVDSPAEAALSHLFRDIVCVGISVNSQANLQHTEKGIIDHLGSKTECALLQHVQRWGNDYRALRNANKSFMIYMFDSTKKSMSTAHSLENGLVRLHTKGAPEMLLPRCDYQLEADGQTVVPLDHDRRANILSAVEDMARRGLRTLLIAYRDFDHSMDDEEFWEEAPDVEMTYLGVVGIKDPIRPEAHEAVRQLKEAGVTVRMVTGDNVLTATYIAKEVGILDEDGLVMEGPEFRALSSAELDKVALKIQVLARSTPNDKLMLVRKHKQLGEVTSVTGDGTNDGPALKEADVGFALGIAGTEIAKEACDIVILDDNIQSMTKAVLWGRNVYISIRKFLQFQLVVNVVAVLLNFISACAGVPLPLGAVPLLWVNMIMDSMGALALATEPPRLELLKRKPFGRTAPLINREMYRNIIGMSVFQLAVCLVLQFGGKQIFRLANGVEICTDITTEAQQKICDEYLDLEVSSIIFNVFVFMQIGSEINSRRITGKNVFEGIYKSTLFLIIIALTVAVQVALMLLAGDSKVGVSIGIAKIGVAGWVTSIILGILVLPWGFLIRFIPLEWCYGVLDEDPTNRSKLEKLLGLGRRRSLPTAEKEESYAFRKQSSGTDDTDASNSPQAVEDRVGAGQRSPSPSLLRLRVFVHAVAFVNVMSRGRLSRTTTMTSNRDENDSS